MMFVMYSSALYFFKLNKGPINPVYYRIFEIIMHLSMIKSR